MRRMRDTGKTSRLPARACRYCPWVSATRRRGWLLFLVLVLVGVWLRADLDRRFDALVGQVERAGLPAGNHRNRKRYQKGRSHRSSIAIVRRETQMRRLRSSVMSMFHTWLRRPRWIGFARPVTWPPVAER